jgi:AcrR family transcriptional regulator
MDGEVPYRRIVAKIRARIACGELRPGDRVPSTRQLIRDHGIAMATATKVIATLRDEGLVDTKPGAGTIVRDSAVSRRDPSGDPTPPDHDGTLPPDSRPSGAGPASSPAADLSEPGSASPAADLSEPGSTSRAGSDAVRQAPGPDGVRARSGARRESELSRERIVRAAIAIADAEGIATLSMRRVATDLGAATMSLYRHVPGKEDLLLSMADAVFAEAPFPERMPQEWRARLTTAGRLMWSVFRRHPWAAEVMPMTRPQIIPSIMAYAEWSIGTLRGLGFGVADTMHAHLALFGHVRSTALSLGQERQAMRDTGLTNSEWMDTQGAELAAIVREGRYPALIDMFQQEFDYDVDAVLEYGLSCLLDGIALRIGVMKSASSGTG